MHAAVIAAFTAFQSWLATTSAYVVKWCEQAALNLRREVSVHISPCLCLWLSPSLHLYTYVSPSLLPPLSPDRRFPLQVALFAFSAYFVVAIRRRQNERKILVPDISQSQVFSNSVPGPDELTYRETTYFRHEMTEVGGCAAAVPL